MQWWLHRAQEPQVDIESSGIQGIKWTASSMSTNLEFSTHTKRFKALSGEKRNVNYLEVILEIQKTESTQTTRVYVLVLVQMATNHIQVLASNVHVRAYLLILATNQQTYSIRTNAQT